MTELFHRDDWAIHPTLWKGEWQGGPAGCSIIFNAQTRPGQGPRLHTHPYAEIFIIRAGAALFIVGEETLRPAVGDIVVVPANTPHKFVSEGDAVFESIDIHMSGTFETTWLE